MIASREGDVDIVDLLLQHNAQVELPALFSKDHALFSIIPYVTL